MSSEQDPEDLGWEPPPEGDKPPCVQCERRNLCAHCDPAGFKKAWLAALRTGIVDGRIAGFPLRPEVVENALRILAENAVAEVERPGLRLPPSLERLSAPTREALAKTKWVSFGGGPQYAPVDRIVAAMGALRIVRLRAGVKAPRRPWERVTGLPVEAELCAELLAAREALFAAPAEKRRAA